MRLTCYGRPAVLDCKSVIGSPALRNFLSSKVEKGMTKGQMARIGCIPCNQENSMSSQTFRTIALIGSMAFITSAAFAANDARLPNGKSMYGAPVDARVATKEVNVATAAAVNVACGEVVAFRNADKTFAWKFDVVGHRAVDLQSIAPAGFVNKPLRIHVATNDMERN